MRDLEGARLCRSLAGINVSGKVAAKHMHIVDVPAKAGSRGTREVALKAGRYIPFSSSSLVNFAV
jgi:hypothetical protein